MTRKRPAARKPLDPTKVRLGKYFMLSDFMGCDSVYRKGMCNRIYNTDMAKVKEGIRLAGFLDRIEDNLGRVSISYGYISPALSKCIVTYQDPDKPSFHRWDLGAACDLRIMTSDWDQEPSLIHASNIAKEFDDANFARMITYAESPWICFATALSEDQSNRRIHEYRYEGVKGQSPKWLKWQNKEQALHTLADSPDLVRTLGDYKGQGYPSYHGGGRKQFHHVQLSEYVNLSDLLYSRDYCHLGIPNTPPKDLTQFHRAAEFLDRLYHHHPYRVSIVGGYEAPSKQRLAGREYERNFYLELVPHEGMEEKEFLEYLRAASIGSERIKVENTSIKKYHVRG